MVSRMNDNQSFKALGNIYCGVCNSQFFIKDFSLKGSRCPMLLHCGHSICENCIQQSLKICRNITCPLCGFMSSLTSAEQIRECFPFSMYLMGNLVALQNYRHSKDKGLKAFLFDKGGSFDYALKEQPSVYSKPDPQLESPCEECSASALWHCENCDSNYCEICWTRVHGFARSLMRHCKIDITNIETSKIGWRKCLQHEFQDLDFFCIDCSITVCSHCAVLHHQGEGHQLITLKEKNLEIIDNVKAAAEDVELINKRMRQTLEKIKLMQTSVKTLDGVYSEAETQIRKNFSRMHGILQLEEECLLKKLHEDSHRQENCVQALRLQLETQIENVKGLLGQCEFAVEKPELYDLTDLHRRLIEVQNLPCYLITQDPCNKEPKVAFDESLIEALQTYCTMDLPSGEMSELRSGSNLPEGYAVEPLEVSDVHSANSDQKPRRESSSSDVDSLKSGSSRDLAKGDLEPSKTTKESKVFMKRRNYSVRVSYIKNPGEFYITLNSQRPRQQAIDKKACYVGERSPAVPTSVKKDKIYLVKYKVDKKWYRARLIEVLPKKIGEEEFVTVYYLDYGNSETVPISRLRSIPADMLEPPLAVRCKLFGCVPKDGEWCVESTKTMEKILNNNYTATMFVMGVHPHCLEVDLSVIYPEGQIGRDIVSVRDALLFLEFSSFVNGPKVPQSETALKYLNQCLPPVGETFDAIITHVNSPSEFYVQKINQDTSYLYKITVDLQNYYSENSERGVIYNPTIGMPCVALFSADQKWYRAQIINIPGKKMVTVFYVDYGNVETIPWTEIRKLRECFVKWPPLALKCSLACVLPLGDTWSTEARTFVEKYVMVRDCSVKIHGKPKTKHVLKVFLYSKETETEVCVNTLICEKGHAVKTDTLCSQKTNYEQKVEILEKENSVSKANKPCQGKRNGEDDQGPIILSGEKTSLKKRKALRDRARSRLSAKELRELHESEKKSYSRGSSPEDVEDEVDEFDDVIKIQVEVLRAESPSSIYVTFPPLTEGFRHLQSKLNEFYQNSAPEAVNWTAGNMCAVFDTAEASWYRALLLSIRPDYQAEVFLKDVARVSTVPISSLRKLDPSFAQYAACAVKCHLADIRPPGDQWPGVSSEYLQNELEQFKEVFMTKKGQIDNMSLPVELWVQKIVPGGALEPSTKEWITFNRLLVDQGLAVPAKQKLWSSSVPSIKECLDDVEESRHEKTEDVKCPSDTKDVEMANVVSDAFIPPFSRKWLLPEPLKRFRFIGIPTYVDFNAYIHMYDREQDEEKLNTIRNTLAKTYGNSAPNPNFTWSPGQLCIARYHADGSWYRGVINKRNEDMTYEVVFVDYGNVETCQVTDLRVGFETQEIPIISHCFQLHGVASTSEDGKWPVSAIEVLHSLVVDKMCEVNVLKCTVDPGGPHVVTLKLIEDDVDVGSFLLDNNLALLPFSENIESDVTWEESESEFHRESPRIPSKRGKHSDVPEHFIPLKIPDTCTSFSIRVTNITSETEFSANITDASGSSGLQAILNGFESLQKELTDECHLQPVIKKLAKGKPCCCVDLKRIKWCRGEIESFKKTENLVSVSYVDHGGREFLHKDLLHECKNEWLRVPKMAVKLRLADVEKCPDVSDSDYMMALTSCLHQSVLFAQILSVEDVPEVRLLTDRDGILAYQEMIDKKLMRFVI